MRRNTLVIVFVIAFLASFGAGMTGLTFHERLTFSPTVEAQQDRPLTADFQGHSQAFAAQSGTGATASTGGLRGTPVNHAIELIVTGGPAACTYRLQGSRDGSTWYNISASDITCTTTTVAFEANKPARMIRGNLLTLSGGTAPTVTLKYVGR